MERKDLEEIAEVIKEHNIFILSDEIYCELTYGNKNFYFHILTLFQFIKKLFDSFKRNFKMLDRI